MARIAEKVPSWVERLLIPTLESRVREIVKEQVGYLEKIIETRFESTNIRVKALEDTLNTRMDSLEKRIPVIEEMAAIKTRLDELERKLATKAY